VTKGKVDPGTVEIIRNALLSIVMEMKVTIMRSAFSSTIQEAQDFSVALFEKDRMICQGDTIPAHTGSCYLRIKSMLEKFPVEKQLAETEKTFHRIHRELYKHAAETEPTEMISLRISAVGRQEKPSLRKGQRETRKAQAVKKEVYFEDIDKFVACDAYARGELPIGFSFKGPAIIFQMDSTTLVYHEQRATVDEYGNIVIEEKL